MSKGLKFAILIVPLLLLSAGCNSFRSVSGAGLVLTTNGGADWQFSNKLKDSDASLSGVAVSSLVFDPFDSNKLVLGSFAGAVYKSDDGGGTWQQILSKIIVYDIAFHPTDSSVIYAAGTFGGHGKALVTRDGGKSWQEIYNEEAKSDPVRTVVINPRNSSEVVIGLQSGQLISSTDGGQHWKLLQKLQTQIQRLYWNDSGLFILLQRKGLLKSVDGGATVSDLTTSLFAQGSQVSQFLANKQAGPFYQAAIDSSGQRIYLAAETALLRSVDGGNSWEALNLPLNTKGVVIRSLAVSQSSPNVLYVGAGATIYKTIDDGSSWQTQSIPTTGYIQVILVDPRLPQKAFAGIYIQ